MRWVDTSYIFTYDIFTYGIFTTLAPTFLPMTILPDIFTYGIFTSGIFTYIRLLGWKQNIVEKGMRLFFSHNVFKWSFLHGH